MAGEPRPPPWIISIHAPREGSDRRERAGLRRGWIFQSTLPARGATFFYILFIWSSSISIHAPREGSDAGASGAAPGLDISIHAPREGSDVELRQALLAQAGISIHAPREGSDRGGYELAKAGKHFNPRSPRGERPAGYICHANHRHFNPRSPRGERPATAPQ